MLKNKPDYKSQFRILKGGKISLVVSALLTSVSLMAAPNGGTVTSGSATITQDGLTTNITQSTQKASINWQGFSIASNETVNFNQPSINSITLNRVIGNERSVIDGALNANGQVWLLNSNGVLFSKTAKINTAGILATTKNISDEDFQAGNYKFTGNSTESVINMGEITASDSGYVAMLANTVQNDGTIKAYKGTVYLTGASEATINLNGNSLVNIIVDKGALDTLVENKGAIIAEGGKIYLTTNAVDELLKGVVNNSGIIEANSFDDMFGEVVLFAHGGEVKVAGEIKAKDGFVETSGREFTFEGADIQAGEWLIDPVNITINQTLADAITTQLESGDVTISTEGSNTPDTSSGESGTPGNIYFDNAIINPTLSSETTFTLKADRSIEFSNSSIEALGNALNVYLSTANSNTASSAGFSMYSNSSIKTNGGDIIIGGALTDGLPSFTTQYENSLSHEITGNSILDAGSGDITIAMISGTAWAQFGRFTLDNNSELKANNINFKTLKSTVTSGDETSDFGIELDITGNSLVQATEDIAVDSEETGNVDFTLEDSILNADGDIAINAQSVTAELNEDDGVIKIIADNLTVNATDEIEIEDAVIKVNDLVELNSNNAISLSNSQILFQNQGILNINAVQGMTSEAFDGGIDSWITGWFEVDTVEAANAIATNDELMMDWAGRTFSSAEEVILWDEGVDGIYSSLAEYWLASVVSLPMITDLKGGTYNSKIFSDGTLNSIDSSTLPILNNGNLAFGDGLSSSITSYGMLKQPLYYNESDERWYKLTFWNYPMDIMIGIGGTSYNDGDLYDTGGEANSLQNAVSNLSLDLSGYANNTGTIKVNMDVTTSAGVLPLTQSYTLGEDTTYVKATTSISNNTGSTVDNARLWIGTQDDYVALSDSNYKTRGNIGENGFEAVADQTSDEAKALIVSENALDSAEGAAVLFYSTTEGTNTIVSDEYGWENIVDADPTSMADVSTSAEDGSYALYLNLGAFPNTANGSVTWYYAAAPVSEVAGMVEQVNESINNPEPQPEPVPEPQFLEDNDDSIQKVITTITNSQQIRVEPPKINSFMQPNEPEVQMGNFAPQFGFEQNTPVSLVSAPLQSQETQRVTLGQIAQMQNEDKQQEQQSNPSMNFRETRVALGDGSLVELVNGGVNLPQGVEQEFYVVKSNSRRGNK